MTAEELNEGVEAAPKKRGRRTNAEIEADLRAKIEAETRESLEAEIRAKIEAESKPQVETVIPQSAVDADAIREQIRAEMQAEQDAKDAEVAAARALAAEARPIAGREVDGDPTIEGSVTINFVEDGLTLLGKVWFRGEELTVNPETRQWTECLLPNGRMILTLDEDEQIDRWGKRFFREGLWRGQRLDALLDDPELDDAEKAALLKAQALRDERYGKVATT